MIRTYLIVVALALLGSCASTAGPVSRADFPDLVNAAASGETLLVFGPGTWTPNSRRMIEMANTGDILNPTFAPWKDGVTLVTPSGLAFAEWDDQRSAYVVIKRIPRANIASADIEVLGVSCALIVQEAHDSTFHVFEFTRGIRNDCATAQLAHAELLNEAR